MSNNREENALWSIFGYLISGLLFWGGAGWAADRWLGTTYLTLVGLLVGAGGAIYLVWLRFGREKATSHLLDFTQERFPHKVALLVTFPGIYGIPAIT